MSGTGHYEGQARSGIVPINDAERAGYMFTEEDRTAANSLMATPVHSRDAHQDTVERLRSLALHGHSVQAEYFLHRLYTNPEQVQKEEAIGLFRDNSGLLMYYDLAAQDPTVREVLGLDPIGDHK